MVAESTVSDTVKPVKSSERYVILDVLRGLALLGIALANFPEFSLYSFLPVEATEVMPTAGIDRVVHYFQYIFIDVSSTRYSRCCSESVSPLLLPMR